jgi:hypothetical protein
MCCALKLTIRLFCKNSWYYFVQVNVKDSEEYTYFAYLLRNEKQDDQKLINN